MDLKFFDHSYNRSYFFCVFRSTIDKVSDLHGNILLGLLERADILLDQAHLFLVEGVSRCKLEIEGFFDAGVNGGENMLELAVE